MTFAELERSINSKLRVDKRKSQEKAIFDYILADVIGRSIARLHMTEESENPFPSVEEVYPTLFDEDNQAAQEKEEQKAKVRDELSALRFKLFADSFNKRFETPDKEVAKD